MTKLLGRWLPLIGGLVLAAGAILPLWGQSELASLLAGVGAMLGVSGASPVSGAEITAAVAQVAAAVAVVVGIVRKFVALYSAPK